MNSPREPGINSLNEWVNACLWESKLVNEYIHEWIDGDIPIHQEDEA